MNRVELNGISIYYKDDYKDKIDYTIKIIKNNYDLFLSSIEYDIVCLFDTDIKGVFSCSDIDSYIDSLIVNSYLTEEYIESIFTDDFEFCAYKLYLIKTFNKEDDDELINKYTIDNLLQIMALRYYLENDNVPKLIEYLKNMDSKDTSEIISWFRNKERFNVYKKILEEQCDYFSEGGDELVKEIELVTSFISNLSREEIYNCRKNNYNDCNRVNINKEQLIIIFNKYLEYINAPLDWIDKFNSLVDEERLIESDKSCCIGRIIKIDFKNNLDDLVKLAHEFAHYISNVLYDYNESTLIEFPSIYHELNMQEFLLQYGFDEKDATLFNKYRLRLEICNFLDYIPILNDIRKLVKGKDIDKESLLKEKITNVRRVDEVFKNNNEYKVLSDDEIINNYLYEIDMRTFSLINNPKIVVVMFRYFVNYILAGKVIEKQKYDINIYDIMNDITMNFNQISDIDEVLNLLNIKDFYKVKK